jgi:hypothetical protein
LWEHTKYWCNIGRKIWSKLTWHLKPKHLMQIIKFRLVLLINWFSKQFFETKDFFSFVLKITIDITIFITELTQIIMLQLFLEDWFRKMVFVWQFLKGMMLPFKKASVSDKAFRQEQLRFSNSVFQNSSLHFCWIL